MQNIHDLGPIEGSLLSLERLQIAHGTETPLSSESHHTLVFVVEGEATLDVDGERLRLGEAHAVVVTETESATLTTDAHCSALAVRIAGGGHLHAPLAREPRLTRISRARNEAATGSRSFQILAGPDNGSIRATLFVGYIPPGEAPWHYHLYDEIVYVLNGRGRVHLSDAGGSHDLHSGSAFRLRPEQIHIVENLSTRDDLTILGVFSPAGSPSAAYLEPDTLAAYRVG